ncbi:peptidase dimerization domain-containing protein, partial [Streptococcus suis]|uniref:peptidase dimerization domain-containing protein n=1 Tax=Streptococcus suis TaxID=1307 RepID=UPI0021F1B899
DDVSGLIIGEPTSNIAYYAHKGSMSCVVTAKGKAAHSSMPHLGTNAVDILVDFVNEMKQEYKNIKEHDKVHELDAVTMIEKHLHRKIGEEESHIYSGFVMLNSVFNGGKQVNSVPHKATAKYNVRTVPEYDSTFVKDLFEKVIRHVGEDYLTVDIP